MNAVLRYPGSKWRIADFIISHFPEHHSYLEPFFGSGAVLFNKSASNIETINDLNGDVVNLFRVIREAPEKLAKQVALTPHSRSEYEAAWRNNPMDEIEKARLFLIKSLQGHGFRSNEKTGWKNDVIGRERSYTVKYWNDLPNGIVKAAKRLKQVQIEQMDARELIKRFNHPGVLIYADPPYLLSTRRKEQYCHEMTSEEEHLQLLETLLQHKGYVIISGYDNELYNKTLKNWSKAKIQSNADGGLYRMETIWMNFQERQIKLEI